MKAKKENKSYRISSDLEKQRYLKKGFDIYDDEGNLLEHSPLKKIAYSEYAKVKAAGDALSDENENLKSENEALKLRLAEMEAGAAAESETTAEEGTKAPKKAGK